MYKSYFFLWLIWLCFATSLNAQKIPSNEEIMLSFAIQNGKTVVLSKDQNDSYLIYRLFAKNNIEFEFPEKNRSSFDQFKYSYYLRGGGKINEGLDLNYIAFTHKNFKYVIYDTYSAVDEKSEIGIKVINIKTQKINNLKGKIKTRKGSLIDFRFNELLKIDDTLYE